MTLFVWQRTITDENGRVVPNAQVEVRDQVSSSLVQLYEDIDGNDGLGNPFNADSDGFVRFYVPVGRYRITASVGEQTRTWENVRLGTLGSDLRIERTAAEISAGVTPSNYQYPAEPVIDARRYGWASDGATNDTTALTSAISVAMESGLPLKLVKGTSHALVSSSTEIASLSGPLRIIGEGNPEIRCTGSEAAYMLQFTDTNGHDFEIEGVTFDAQQIVSRIIRLQNPSSSMDEIGRALFRRCTFKNAYMNTGQSQGAAGCFVTGGFEDVVFEDCIVRNISRDTGAGTVGSQGSAGLSVTFSSINAYARKIVVRGGVIDTVTNNETTGEEADSDCDGIIAAVPLASQNGNQHVPATFLCEGTRFVNCKGRNIKTQVDGFSIIRDFTVVRDSIATNECKEFDIQRGGGIVADGVLYIYEVSGGGSSMGESHAIVRFDSDQTATDGDNNDGGIFVRNLVVYNSVPRATDSLPIFAIIDTSDNTKRQLSVDIKNCALIGGRAQRFVQVTGGSSAALNVSIENLEADITTSLLRFVNAVDDDAKVYVANCKNIQSANSPVLLELGSSSEPLLSGHSNTGFVPHWTSRSVSDALGQVFRPGLIGGDDRQGHAFAAPQSVTLADDASHTFEALGNYGVGILTNNFNETTQVIFAHGTANVLEVYQAGTTSAAVSVGTSNTNPNVDGDLNIWIDSSQQINIMNRLGSSRTFHLFHFGGS